MGFKEDCKNIEIELTDLSNNIRVVQSNQENLFVRLSGCKEDVRALKENIRILKTVKVVVVASEYLKSKHQLVLAEQHLVGLTTSYNEATAKLEQLRAIFHKMIETYKQFRKGRGVVLQGNFKGRKRG